MIIVVFVDLVKGTVWNQIHNINHQMNIRLVMNINWMMKRKVEVLETIFLFKFNDYCAFRKQW